MFHKGFQDYKTIFGFYGDVIKRNGAFSRANRLMKYARSYMLISRLIKYMSMIISFIETSAVLIILSSVLLVLVPVFLVTVGVFSLFSLIQFRTFGRELAPILNGSEKVMFIFSSRGWGSKRSSFLRGMSRDFKDQGYTVFVVSRPLFKDGVNAAAKIEDGLWMIKLNYFYIIKRKFLKNFDNTKLIYIS